MAQAPRPHFYSSRIWNVDCSCRAGASDGDDVGLKTTRGVLTTVNEQHAVTGSVSKVGSRHFQSLCLVFDFCHFGISLSLGSID